MESYEYAIIGQGAAAFAAAIKANDLGIKTVMFGHNVTAGTLIGGTCVNVGCVPSKTLITESNVLDKYNYNRFPGIDYDVKVTEYARAEKEKDRLVNAYRKSKYFDVLQKLKNVTFIDDFAELKRGKVIKSAGKEFKAHKILIAAGARANIPKIKGIESVQYLTNEEALSLKKVPDSIVFLGGGAIALELAQMFKHYGSDVHVLERSNKILSKWEPEVSSHIQEYLLGSGINLYTDSDVKEVFKEKEKIVVKATISGRETDIKAEKLIVSTGRTPNIERFDLIGLGINTDKKGFIKIKDTMETSSTDIYAAGDVTGEPMLEALAAKEGNIATHNAFTKRKKRIRFNEIPSAIFTLPEAARVGLTDKEASERGIKCSCRTVLLKDVPKANIIRDTRGLIKMVIDSRTKRILGVEIVSENAADIIHEATLAIKSNLKIDDIIDTVHVFPTLSEAIKIVAQSFYRPDIINLSCCTE